MNTLARATSMVAMCAMLASGAAYAQTGSTTTAPATPAPSGSSASMGSAAMTGRHSMDGEVTKVDAKKGWVDVKTDEGSMKLHLPSTALSNVKKGDRVTVELAMAKTASADMSKSPRTTTPKKSETK